MRCRDVLDLSTAYIDGDLDDRRSSAVRGHLRVCADCERAIADEAALRDAAANLEPLDPPASMWSAIERRLEVAEIEDSRRSRLWLWWQAARPHLLYAGVGVAAVLAAAIWLGGGREGAAPAGTPPEVAATEPVHEQRAEFAPDVDDSGVDDADQTQLERAMRELSKADEHYLSAITELRTMAEEERATWSSDQAARYDKRVAEFEQVTVEHRKRLAHDESGDPATRDALFALYQAEIEFLQGAALGEL